jgi:hypothetical protein
MQSQSIHRSRRRQAFRGLLVFATLTVASVASAQCSECGKGAKRIKLISVRDVGSLIDGLDRACDSFERGMTGSCGCDSTALCSCDACDYVSPAGPSHPRTILQPPMVLKLPMNNNQAEHRKLEEHHADTAEPVIALEDDHHAHSHEATSHDATSHDATSHDATSHDATSHVANGHVEDQHLAHEHEPVEAVESESVHSHVGSESAHDSTQHDEPLGIPVTPQYQPVEPKLDVPNTLPNDDFFNDPFKDDGAKQPESSQLNRYQQEKGTPGSTQRRQLQDTSASNMRTVYSHAYDPDDYIRQQSITGRHLAAKSKLIKQQEKPKGSIRIHVGSAEASASNTKTSTQPAIYNQTESSNSFVQPATSMQLSK